MLNKTFCHVHGLSEKKEKELWDNKIISWQDFLDSYPNIPCIGSSDCKRIYQEILFSKHYLDSGQITYFGKKLPSKELWRTLFHGSVGYVDIETTGLSKYTDEITVIGISDGDQVWVYTKEDGYDKALDLLNNFDILVSFNGKKFDIPFIEHQLGELDEHIHLDLRYMLYEFGLRGGLKNIETQLGIRRNDDLGDIDGREAVRLWKRYKMGDRRSLDLLKEYNKADVLNLKSILDWYSTKKLSIIENLNYLD